MNRTYLLAELDRLGREVYARARQIALERDETAAALSKIGAVRASVTEQPEVLADGLGENCLLAAEAAAESVLGTPAALASLTRPAKVATSIVAAVVFVSLVSCASAPPKASPAPIVADDDPAAILGSSANVAKECATSSAFCRGFLLATIAREATAGKLCIPDAHPPLEVLVDLALEAVKADPTAEPDDAIAAGLEAAYPCPTPPGSNSHAPGFFTASGGSPPRITERGSR